MKKLQYIKSYKLYHKKIKQDFKIVSFSDIHFSEKVTKEKLDALVDTVGKEKPNYILIPGDLIDSSNMVEKTSERIRIRNWIKTLSKQSKVIISLGNHDYYQRGIFFEGKEKKKVRYFYDKEFFQSLDTMKNVYLLDNDIYQDENVYIAGIRLPFEYYQTKHKEEDKSLLKKAIKENSSILSNLPEEKIKILMLHAPIFLTEKDIEKELKEFNYFISGHMHNGCVFPILDELWNTTYGIISPKKTFFPKNARNTLRKKEDKLIVNGAITTFQACTKWMQVFNILFPMYISTLTFTNDPKWEKKGIDIEGKYQK